MGLFNNFPYMDLSNLNLDFILKKLKDLTNYTQSAEQAAESAEQSASSAQQSAESAEQSASSAQQSAESAEGSADTAQNYAEHIADPVGGLVTTWLDDNITPTTPPVDASLTIQGAAADAKKTGDEISELRSELSNSMPVVVKLALDNMLAHVPFNDYEASNDYATFHAWASDVTLLSISAVFNQGDNVIYTHDSLDALRQYLTVTAHFGDGTSTVVTSYQLSGDLVVGTSTITATYGGKSTTFNVTVAQGIPSTYTKVSYITAPQVLPSGSTTPRQYINLPYSSDSSKTYKMETYIKWGPWSGSIAEIMGFNGFGYFGYQTSSNMYLVDSVATSGSNTGIPAGEDFDALEFTIEPSVGNALKVNGTTAASSRSTWTGGKPLCLFANNSGSQLSGGCRASMKYFKLYIDDVLTMNLFPCYRNSDNAAGLYDIIGGAFYPSEGDDAFTYEA